MITTEKARVGEYQVIDNVTFSFINIRYPVNKFESEKKEFNVSCTISEDDFDELESRKYKISYESIKNDKYTSRFKIDLPFPDQRKQTVIRLSASADRKNKQGEGFIPLGINPTDEGYGLDLRPKVVKIVDGKEVDITTTALSNGCKGKVYFGTFTNSFGTMCYLRKIVLDEVVEYVKPEEPTSAE